MQLRSIVKRNLILFACANARDTRGCWQGRGARMLGTGHCGWDSTSRCSALRNITTHQWSLPSTKTGHIKFLFDIWCHEFAVDGCQDAANLLTSSPVESCAP